MILQNFFKLFFILLFTVSTYANESIDDKVKKLTLELRCMTCQNQSVYDSDAEFSNDIKNIVRKQFNEGKSSKEIKIFLKERYGEYILFKPLFDYKNMFLWIFPFIMLIIGLFFIIFKVRRNI